MNNRIIKFRAWDKTNKKMLDETSYDELNDTIDDVAYLIAFDGSIGRMWKDKSMRVVGKNVVNPHAIRFTTKWAEKFILMQFTGLHDKNGKEIYEGDIVNYNNKLKLIGIVEWWGEVAQWGISTEKNFGLGTYGGAYSNQGKSSMEVIGNVHETPNLITKTNEQPN